MALVFLDASAEDKTKSTNIRHLQSENLQTSYQNKSQISDYNIKRDFSF